MTFDTLVTFEILVIVDALVGDFCFRKRNKRVSLPQLRDVNAEAVTCLLIATLFSVALLSVSFFSAFAVNIFSPCIIFAVIFILRYIRTDELQHCAYV